MTIIEKRKRKRMAQPRWPVLLGRGFVGFAMIYTSVALLDIAVFFGIYGTIAGVLLTFLWPAICFSAFLGLQWNRYRTQGQSHHARGIAYLLLGFAIMCVGLVDVIAGGFVA